MSKRLNVKNIYTLKNYKGGASGLASSGTKKGSVLKKLFRRNSTPSDGPAISSGPASDPVSSSGPAIASGSASAAVSGAAPPTDPPAIATDTTTVPPAPPTIAPPETPPPVTFIPQVEYKISLKNYYKPKTKTGELIFTKGYAYTKEDVDKVDPTWWNNKEQFKYITDTEERKIIEKHLLTKGQYISKYGKTPSFVSTAWDKTSQYNLVDTTSERKLYENAYYTMNQISKLFPTVKWNELPITTDDEIRIYTDNIGYTWTLFKKKFLLTPEVKWRYTTQYRFNSTENSSKIQSNTQHFNSYKDEITTFKTAHKLEKPCNMSKTRKFLVCVSYDGCKPTLNEGNNIIEIQEEKLTQVFTDIQKYKKQLGTPAVAVAKEELAVAKPGPASKPLAVEPTKPAPAGEEKLAKPAAGLEGAP